MKKIKRVFLLVLIAYVGVTFFKQQTIIHRQKDEKEKYSLELKNIKNENEKLQDEMKLAEDNKYIEKLAREKLGLIKEGETPVIDNSDTK